MDGIQIFEHALTDRTAHFGKVAILQCATRTTEPKQLLDTTVYTYVGHGGYNEFIEINLDNPWMRLIISGINDYNYREFKEDAECFEQDLPGSSINQICRVAIIRGGLMSERPFTFMNDIVTDYVNGSLYNQFIEIHMDNPWVRVVLIGLNDLTFEPFTNQRLHEEN